MITEYTNTFLNPLPYKKWYLLYNIQDKQILEPLSVQEERGGAMTVATDVMYVTFDSEEEGETFIKENSLVTHDIINRYRKGT